MQKKLKIALSLVIALVLITTVYATIVVYQEVPTSITILAVYGMEVYDVDGKTLLETIDFGQHHRGDSFLSPVDYDTNSYYIKNTGEEADIWISFSVTGWMNDVEIKLGCEGFIFPDEISPNSIAPGETVTVFFSISISSTAEFGSYTPTITFNAYNTAEG